MRFSPKPSEVLLPQKYGNYIIDNHFADYAVQVFYDAIETGHHTCFLGPDTRLPMMYISDCIKVDLNLSSSKFGFITFGFCVVLQRTVVMLRLRASLYWSM